MPAQTAVRRSPITSSYVFLIVAYVLLGLILPANKLAMRQYHLQSTEYHVLMFVLSIPVLCALAASAFSNLRLRQYTKTIAGTKEGASFQKIMLSCNWLSWGILVPAITATILNAIANSHPAFHQTAIIITNYMNVVPSVVVFSLLASASSGLLRQNKVAISDTANRTYTIIAAILSVLCCLFSFQHFDLHHLGSTNNPYFLPVWLLVLTITIPFIYAWINGLLAVIQIIIHSRHVKGILYRRPLQLLASGVSCAVGGSIALQYFRTITPRIGHLSLNATLLVTTLSYFLLTIGFVAISFGANRLKQIEEV